MNTPGDKRQSTLADAAWGAIAALERSHHCTQVDRDLAARKLREALALPSASGKPVAWHYCVAKPGEAHEWASIDPDDSMMWPKDQWTLRYEIKPLYAAPLSHELPNNAASDTPLKRADAVSGESHSRPGSDVAPLPNARATEGSCYFPDETRPSDYYDHFTAPRPSEGKHTDLIGEARHHANMMEEHVVPAPVRFLLKDAVRLLRGLADAVESSPSTVETNNAAPRSEGTRDKGLPDAGHSERADAALSPGRPAADAAPTPMTDEFWGDRGDGAYRNVIVQAAVDFCRKLERELAHERKCSALAYSELEAARSSTGRTAELESALSEALKNHAADLDRMEQELAAVRSATQDTARWNLVRRWLTNQEQLYIPGIHQARTIDAVNEAVDRAIAKYASTDGTNEVRKNPSHGTRGGPEGEGP